MGGTHSSQIQIASGQDLQPGEMTSAPLAPRSSCGRMRICQMADRDRHDLRQSINRTPDGVAGASHAWCDASLDHVQLPSSPYEIAVAY